MIKEPFENGLGKALKNERKRRRLRQDDLAQTAGLSAPTIRLLEQGRGTLKSWTQALQAIGAQLLGKNLPPGRTIGDRLATLRRRRRLSQRELARLVGVSHPTIVELERRSRGRLATFDRTLAILGAGPVLSPTGRPPNFFIHAGNSSGAVHWNTPPKLLGTLSSVFGKFDLDPCSPTSDKRRAPVRARVYFTAEDDGLNLPWHGTVFLNPPYGRAIAHWIRKAKDEVRSGRVKTVVAVLPARTDTIWWHDHIATDAAVVFLRGRLSFGAGGQSAPFPSAIVLWGASAEQIRALSEAIPAAWSVAPSSKAPAQESPLSRSPLPPST